MLKVHRRSIRIGLGETVLIMKRVEALGEIMLLLVLGWKMI